MCPICSHDCVSVRHLSPTTITTELQRYYSLPAPPSPEICNQKYELMSCQNCSLEFASPMVPGSSEYYNFLANQKGYYPSFRWEYKYVKDNFLSTSSFLSLLDIGCGSGVFLDYIKDLSYIGSQGIDLSPEAVSACINKGLKASQCDIYDFIKNSPKLPDIAVSFHCLEHVKDPVQFIESLKPVCDNGGRILTSTPYSPMTVEASWFDILNHPPHHLTRWNAKAYSVLAQHLNLKCIFHTPPTASFLSLCARSTLLQVSGIQSLTFYKTKKLRILFKNLPSFFSNCVGIFNREKINGYRAADVVLVEWLKI